MNFGLYFQLGLEHITDPYGYDHILFIIAICASWRVSDWRTVAILVTAFTLGHSIALALATFEIVPVWSALIEFLIPVSIMASCVQNISYPPSERGAKINKNWAYGLIAAFGIIHGLGFSNFLKETLVANESLLTPLLGFNLGLEIGQLLIVAICFAFNYIFVELAHKAQRDWTLVVSSAVAGIAFLLCLEKGAELFFG